jgi:hypothetical protein
MVGDVDFVLKNIITIYELIYYFTFPSDLGPEYLLATTMARTELESSRDTSISEGRC